MSRNKLKERNQRIYDDYLRWTGPEEGRRHDWACERIAQEHYLEGISVGRIVNEMHKAAENAALMMKVELMDRGILEPNAIKEVLERFPQCRKSPLLKPLVEEARKAITVPHNVIIDSFKAYLTNHDLTEARTATMKQYGLSDAAFDKIFTGS